jgi:KEOPS complex subunit Pcc1
MLALDAQITISTKEKTQAIFDSINADNQFYPENPTRTKISTKKNQIQITIQAVELSHLRANINSILRLIQASADSIESVKI